MATKPARHLNEGDILSDGRVVKTKAFGPSTHDPALMVWFEDGTEQLYFNNYQEVTLNTEESIDDDTGRSSSEG